MRWKCNTELVDVLNSFKIDELKTIILSCLNRNLLIPDVIATQIMHSIISAESSSKHMNKINIYTRVN